MIIVMKKNATDGQIDRVVEWIESVGYRAHLSRGTEKTIIGAVGDARGREQIKSVAHLPGVEKVVPILKPYKLAEPRIPGSRHDRPRGRGRDRRAAVHRHGGALLRRDGGAAHGVRLRGEKGRRPDPPGRRLQAPDLALQLPGPGGGGAEAPEEGPRADGAAHRDGGRESRRRGPRRGLRRHPPDRRAQRPEFRAPEEGGPGAQARPAQAGDDDDDRGAPHVGRVHPLRGQQPGHPLRAGDPHLRDGHAKHPGSLGRRRPQGAHPPPGDRGPEPCGGPLEVRDAPGPGGRRRGGRRDHRRGPPRARKGRLRRDAVPEAGEVLPAHGRPGGARDRHAADRRGCRHEPDQGESRQAAQRLLRHPHRLPASSTGSPPSSRRTAGPPAGSSSRTTTCRALHGERVLGVLRENGLAVETIAFPPARPRRRSAPAWRWRGACWSRAPTGHRA